MKLTRLLIALVALICVSCECPYQDELDCAQQRKSSTGDVFYADVLLGTWQCYYPMIISGVEFKQIKFMSGGKADITMAQQHDTEWYTETYNYSYYGNTLRFSRSGSNISLTIEGYLFPELYLRDSFGHYTMAKRRADGC
ncbi:MAG: hypothetical protein E7104_06375 [Prevotella sp.]|nr:hypothetical protein [Prevotella sp.]MBE6263571.1 hypothetical protein [Prevotella sp.]